MWNAPDLESLLDPSRWTMSAVSQRMPGEQIMSLLRTRLPGLMLIAVLLPACSSSSSPPRKVAHVTVTPLRKQAIRIARQFPCQIQSQHHIDVRTPIKGYLTAISVKDGDTVQRDDLLFQISSSTDKDRQPIEDQNDPGQIKASFAGMIGSLRVPQGSAVQQGETLTTLSDSSQMRVDFNVPEARFREFERASQDQPPDDAQIELIVNGEKFDHPGKLDSTSLNLGPKEGTFTLRADFPNPNHILRHGKTGTVVVSLMQHDALVVPQNATFEVQGNRYVYVVDNSNVAHRRAIEIQSEVGDLFVIDAGVGVDDRIVLDGVRTIQDGDTVTYDDPPASYRGLKE